MSGLCFVMFLPMLVFFCVPALYFVILFYLKAIVFAQLAATSCMHNVLHFYCPLKAKRCMGIAFVEVYR